MRYDYYIITWLASKSTLLIIVRQAALKALKQNRRISESNIVAMIHKYQPQLNPTTIEECKKKGEFSNGSDWQNTPNKIGFAEYK